MKLQQGLCQPRLCLRSNSPLVFKNQDSLYQVDPYQVKFDDSESTERVVYDYTGSISEDVIMIASSFTKFYLVHQDMRITGMMICFD